MNTVQEPLAGAAFHPPSFPIGNFPEEIRTKEPTKTGHPASPPRKGGQQDALFAGDKVIPSDEPERGTSSEPLPGRCQFAFSDGRQCRMSRSDIHPSLCRYHAEREDQLFGEPGVCVAGASLDLPELYSACGGLSTATGVNRVLTHVFRLLAQRRISRQEAATFGHLAQLLLRTVSLMRAESADPANPPLGGGQPRRNVYHLPQEGYPLAAKVHQQDELSPPQEVALFAGNNDALSEQRESRDIPVSSPVNQQKRERAASPVSSPVNKVEPERDAGLSPPTPSRGTHDPYNRRLHKRHLQLARNEHLPNPGT